MIVKILWAFLVFIGLGLLFEVGARGYHRFHFLMPFKAKIIAEYPYTRFVEKAEPPLFFRFKKGFHSDKININRFGLRGKEPAADGTKKRMLVLGESDYFGPKLNRETDMWNVRLEKILGAKGHSQWEILTGGNPGYNTVQHRAFWDRELNRVHPDILLLRIGGFNDISQAFVMGSKWEPGAPWPFEFILKLERKRPWWQGLLGRSAVFFFLRRHLAEQKADAFKPVDDKFQWEACKENAFSNQRALIEDAMARGIKVALVSWAPSYEVDMHPENRQRIAALQSNWQSFIKGWAPFQFEYFQKLSGEFAPKMGVPYIDLTRCFWDHPRRFELYLDLVHFNADGYKVLAESLYAEIERLGWWGETGKQEMRK